MNTLDIRSLNQLVSRHRGDTLNRDDGCDPLPSQVKPRGDDSQTLIGWVALLALIITLSAVFAYFIISSINAPY